MASDSPLPNLRSKSAFFLPSSELIVSIIVGLTLVHLFAIGLCQTRLYLRVKEGRVWWDDRVVLGAAALDVVYTLTL